MTFLIQPLVLAVTIASVFGQSPNIEPIPGGRTGDGITTHYWDCSKQSCCWRENIPSQVPNPVRSCAVDGSTTIDPETHSICENGYDVQSYMCSDQQPWIVNSTLSYGFAAVSFTGSDDNSRCCACFLLAFKGQLQGKYELVQITNTGGPLFANHFDISTPGGGTGDCPQSCPKQWNVPDGGWASYIEGIQTKQECYELPSQLQPGCLWRWDFLEGVQNPDVSFTEVKCPSELTSITKCTYNY